MDAQIGGGHALELQRNAPEEWFDLQESLYPLSDAAYADELAFWKTVTGIVDNTELKQHILAVQSDAYRVYNYPCIRGFSFLKFNLCRHPKYTYVIETGKRDEKAILLDVGCFFGVDLRKAIIDGYPARSVLGTDLREEWFALSGRLCSGAHSASPAFLAGDIFDDTFLDPSNPTSAPTASMQPLAEVTTLTSLKRRAHFVYSHSFFHLFQEDAQRDLARRLASLLDDEPGAMLFGAHAGLPAKGYREQGPTSKKMFCHSPESWKGMIAQVFAEQGRRVVQEAELVQVFRPHHGTGTGFTSVLVWSAILEANEE